jgi:hypothetical protein
VASAADRAIHIVDGMVATGNEEPAPVQGVQE